MHPPFGKPVLLLPVRCCMPSISYIWLTLGELLHMLRALAPTYHDPETNWEISTTLLLRSKEIFPNLHHHDQCNFFFCGAWNGTQHVSSTMKLGPSPLWSWWGGVNGCAWYHRHPTARPQLRLATKNKTAPLTINAAFWCGKCPDAIWKFLKNEGCMPPLFSPPQLLPLPTNKKNLKRPFLIYETSAAKSNHFWLDFVLPGG